MRRAHVILSLTLLLLWIAGCSNINSADNADLDEANLSITAEEASSLTTSENTADAGAEDGVGSSAADDAAGANTEEDEVVSVVEDDTGDASAEDSESSTADDEADTGAATAGDEAAANTTTDNIAIDDADVDEDVAESDTDSVLVYERYTLDNGLAVILVEDHTAPVVAVDVWYQVGGANDPAGRSGFAHLFEHMMFQGTANLNKDQFLRLIEDAGGSLNAYTSTDQTVYYETLPSHQLPLGLWLEADRMASLAVTQTNLDNQRAVVIEEYQQRYGNSPYGMGILEILTRPFTYTPYQTAPIGSIEDLNAATVEEIREFHETYYLPNNATLVVAGDIDLEQTRELVDLYFAAIPAGETPPALPDWEPEQQDEAEIITLEDDLIRVPGVFIGYETPPRQHPDYPAIQIMNFILSTGDSSRMAQNLVDTGQALVADTVVLDNRGPSLFGVLLLPNMGVEINTIEQLYYDELTRILEEGVPQDELDKAINIIRSGRITSLESAFGLAESVQTAVFYYDDPNAVFNEIERFELVTSEDIQRVIAEYLEDRDRHVIYINPGEPQQIQEPEPFVGATGDPSDDAFETDFALEITEPPEPLEIREFNLPAITENTLENGLEVIVIEAPELPVLSVDLVLKGGGSLVPAEQSGLAGITASLLTRGTRTRSAQEIASTIERQGGTISASASNDMLTMGVFSLIEDGELAFDLLSDVALNANFPQEELDRQIAQITTSLESALSDPDSLVGRAFNQIVYNRHPYGNATTLSSLEAIDRDAVIAYYERIRHPENAFLIVAGRITTEEALEFAEATFGDWRGEGEPPTIEFAKPENPVGELDIVLVDVPGAEQAEIIIGNLGVQGTNPERYTIAVMNSILGVGFPSRLMQNLREDKGYSYGIGSRFNYPVDYGTFRIVTSVRTDSTADALNEILLEVKRIQNELVDEAELVGVRDGMIGRYALQFETYQDFINQIASFSVRGVPIEDIAIYPDRIGAVDAAAVHEAAQTYIPEEFVIVVAGDSAELLEQLQSVGDVQVIQPEDVVNDLLDPNTLIEAPQAAQPQNDLASASDRPATGDIAGIAGYGACMQNIIAPHCFTGRVNSIK